MNLRIELVDTKRTLELRHRILKPHLPFENTLNPGDDASTTFHFALFKQYQLISIATFIHESHTNLHAGFPYRLRGMATDHDFQNKGFGQQLLNYAHYFLTQKGCDLIWCNARQNAFSFYQRLGYQSIGELFEITHIGPHKVMYKRLSTR